jgi:predicted permease
MIEALLQDLRYALRMMKNRPGFTLVVVLVMAIGIGANTAIFSVVDAFLLRPLPYAEADRLVRVESRFASKELSVCYPDYLDWREQSASVEDLAFFNPSWLANVDFNGEVEALPGVLATANLFSVLRVKPLIGRAFEPEDDLPSSPEVVILSHDLWQRRFGADPNVLGRTLTTDTGALTVIGVMPRGFKFPSQFDMWVAASRWFNKEDRSIRIDKVIGRLRQGVTLDEARREMAVIADRLAEQYPATNEGVGAAVTSERELWVGDVRPALLLILSACGFVLLIACANVANLLLARAGAREREVAIRTALGARRSRLIRQLLVESLMLGLAGGAAGLVMADRGVKLLTKMLPAELPFWVDIRLDLAALGFTLAVSTLTGLLFGLAPALQVTRVNLNESLKEGGRGSSGGARSRRVRRLLVISEVALALVLLIGAGLMMKSFLRLSRSSPGFDADRALMIEVNTPPRRDPDAQTKSRLYREALERLAALPGVEAAGANSDLPLVGQESWDRVDFTVEGQSADEQKANPIANSQQVSPDYFRAMGIPLLAGRHFTEQDTTESASVVIVSRGMAERFWPGEDPIGKRLKWGGVDSENDWDTVVGVVGDVNHHGLTTRAGMDMYGPRYNRWKEIHFVVRAGGDPASVVPAARKAIWDISPDLGISRIEPMRNLVRNSIWQPRLWGMLVGLFSAVALMMAVAGIYSVMSYVVSQRTHEIGVRMALGARPRDVLLMVIAEGMAMAAAGALLGLAGALAATRLLASQLYGVEATDPAAFAGAALLFTAVALAASYVPARRATRVDPMVALRCE